MNKFVDGQTVVFTGVSEKLKHGDIGKVIDYCGLLNYKVEFNGNKYIVSHGVLSDYTTHSLLLMKDLQAKVESLEKRIEQLENDSSKEKTIATNIYTAISDRLDSKAFASKILETLNKHNKVEAKLSNNELRKKIIKEAKQFIEEHEPYTFKTIIKETGELEYKKIKLVEYKIDVKNKTVTCCRFYLDSTHTNKAVAKCLDTDIFNVHIGKAIALGRLKGLDVSKFEDAIQPDKVVVGMEVLMNYTDQTRVIKKIESNSKLFFTNGNHDMLKNVVSILDDTNAKY